MAKVIKGIQYFFYQTQRYNILTKMPVIIMQKSFRNIHCNMKLHKKMFMEHENHYAYGIMENKGYVTNLQNNFKSEIDLSKQWFDSVMQEDWNRKKPSEMFEIFAKLASYSSENGLCISNSIFDTFIDSLTDNMKHASDKELQSLFYSLLQWPETASIRTRNFIEVWAALDDACLCRIRQWSFDTSLSFVSLFFMVNVTRVSEFSYKCLQRLASKASQLTPQQLVQTMFFVGIMRKSPDDIHNLELQLDKHLNALNIDELAIISMGFFKSKTPIRSMELICAIISKVIENAKDVHQVSLAALLKIIRYSMKTDKYNQVYKLLDALSNEIPRLSVMCNVHLALLGTGTLTYHEKCLREIMSTTILHISETRIKDLERLVLTCGIFNFVPNTKESFFEKVLNELRKPERLPETKNHGRSFACCVSYLGYLGIYPVDLMSKVLSKEFLCHTYGKHVMGYGREVLVIHNSAKIFCPQADMHRLSDKFAVMLAKKYTDYFPDENYKKQYNVSERFSLDVYKVLRENRGGDKYVVGDHILTHHQRGDIIICNDHNGLPVEVTQHFNLSKFGTMKPVPDDNYWIVLVIAGRNALIQNTDTATGPFKTKIRELESLGYHAALVSWNKYSNLTSNEMKINFLNQLIDEAINNSSKHKLNMSSSSNT